MTIPGNNNQVIAQRLISLRQAFNLSQKEFAKRVGLSQSAISQFEKNQRFPAMTSLVRIAETFGLSLDDLIKGTQETTTKNLVIQGIAGKLKRLSDEDILIIDFIVNRLLAGVK